MRRLGMKLTVTAHSDKVPEAKSCEEIVPLL